MALFAQNLIYIKLYQGRFNLPLSSKKSDKVYNKCDVSFCNLTNSKSYFWLPNYLKSVDPQRNCKHLVRISYEEKRKKEGSS